MSLLFLGQVFASASAGVPVLHSQKDLKITQTKANSSNTYLDVAIENELDEDDFDDLNDFHLADIQKAHYQTPYLNSKSESEAHLIFCRINSAVRIFTCVFII